MLFAQWGAGNHRFFGGGGWNTSRRSAPGPRLLICRASGDPRAKIVPPARFLDALSNPPSNQIRKSAPPEGGTDFLGGGGWIRTTEAIRNRFTVCPIWPLWNSSIWSWLTDLNPRPADYKSAALPTELNQQISKAVQQQGLFYQMRRRLSRKSCMDFSTKEKFPPLGTGEGERT